MQTRKMGHVAALKGDTSKKHGSITQTGTKTAPTSKPEVREKTNKSDLNDQNEMLSVLWQARRDAWAAIRRAERAIDQARQADNVLRLAESRCGTKHRTFHIGIHNFREAIEACKPDDDGSIGCALTWAGFRQQKPTAKKVFWKPARA